MRPNEPCRWWRLRTGRPPSGIVRVTLRLPLDVVDRLRAVGDYHGAAWSTLASAIICEWIGRRAPYRVRPLGAVPWWERRRARAEKEVRDVMDTQGSQVEPLEAQGASPCRVRRQRNGLSVGRLALYAGVSDAAVRRLEGRLAASGSPWPGAV